MMRWAMVGIAVMALLLAVSAGVSGQADDDEAPPPLLSAYFGLDNSMPQGIVRWCRGGGGMDGMPVIFPLLLDRRTVQPEDFAVTSASGAVMTPICAVFEPATDVGELRTVLLVGELGDDGIDPPVSVRIVGDILAEDGRNLLGAEVEVTPLAAGPTLVLGESVPMAQADACPKDVTLQAVRAVWAGGITRENGDEADDSIERALYRVTLRLADGSLAEVVPVALVDVGDGDNNHTLCLDIAGAPVSIFFPAGYLYDPNRDTPNPDTTITIAATQSP